MVIGFHAHLTGPSALPRGRAARVTPGLGLYLGPLTQCPNLVGLERHQRIGILFS